MKNENIEGGGGE